jgi:hypothetical protein
VTLVLIFDDRHHVLASLSITEIVLLINRRTRGIVKVKYHNQRSLLKYVVAKTSKKAELGFTTTK